MSELLFKVAADTASASSSLKRLLAPLTSLKKQSDAASKSLDKIGKADVTPKVDTAGITKAISTAERKLAELRSQLVKQVTLGVDTKATQAAIRKVEGELKTLRKAQPPIHPQVDTKGVVAAFDRARAARDRFYASLKQKTGITALSGIKSSLSDVGGALGAAAGKFSSFVSGAGSAFKAISVPILGTALAGITAIAGAIGLTAGKALILADSFQRSRLQLNSFTDNMKVTDTLLSNVQKYADTTPFEFPELVSASRRLLGVGTAAKEIPKQLALIGNVAAQSGADVDELALIFAQMVSNGRVSAEDMNQLADRGVNAWGALSEATGKTVSDLRDLSSKGKLGAHDIQLLWDTLGKGAAGATDALAKTLDGQLSTLKDTLNGTLRDIGNALLPIANSIMPGIQKSAEGFGDKIAANLPTIVNIAAEIATAFVDLPGTILRGLATISQGVAQMVSGVQTSLSDLVSGIADALDSLPFSDVDTSGLRDAALGLAQASIQTNKVGEDSFNGLNTAAEKADQAVAPLAANIEKARQAAQQQIKLDADTKDLDTKIAAAKKKVETYGANAKNPRLKADKDEWDKQLKDAEADLKKLQAQKADVIFKADTAPFKKKLAEANRGLASLAGKKGTPEINAKIDKFLQKKKQAIHELAVLNVKKANPKLDANSAAFKTKVAAAEKKLKATDKKKATVTVDASNKASPVIAKVDRDRKNLDGKSATVTIKTNRVNIGKKPGSQGSGTPVGAMAPASTSSPVTVELYVRDEALAALIDVRVNGQAARASRVLHRKDLVTL